MKKYVKQINKKQILYTIILCLTSTCIISFYKYTLDVIKQEKMDAILKVENDSATMLENEDEIPEIKTDSNIDLETEDEKIIYQKLDELEGVQEIEMENYSVSEVIFGDVHEDIEKGYPEIKISYPQIEIFGDEKLSDKINKIFEKEVFPFDEPKQEVLDNPGMVYWRGKYTITYADSDIISLQIKASGGTGTVEGYNKGITICLKTGEKLTLESFDITAQDLTNAMKDSIVYMSYLVSDLQTTTDNISLYYEDGYNIRNEVKALNTNQYTNFFIGSDSVYIIISTSPFRAEKTGYIKIAYDWVENYKKETEIIK